MIRIIPVSTCLVLLALGASAVSAAESPAVYAGQFKITKTVSNVQLTIPTKIYLSVDIGLAAPTIHIRAAADLDAWDMVARAMSRYWR